MEYLHLIIRIGFKPDTTFENTKIPDINILHGIGSIYDIIVYSHVKSEAEITKIGNLLKDIHNLHMSTISDALKGLTKQVKGIVEQHLLVQKQISTLNTRMSFLNKIKRFCMRYVKLDIFFY